MSERPSGEFLLLVMIIVLASFLSYALLQEQELADRIAALEAKNQPAAISLP